MESPVKLESPEANTGEIKHLVRCQIENSDFNVDETKPLLNSVNCKIETPVEGNSKDETNSAETEQPLSKRQMKKRERKIRYESFKKDRRKKDREKRTKRKAEAKEQGIERSGPSRKQLKRVKMETSSCRIKVAIDMSYDDLMSDKDVAKTLKQLQFCYSANRRAANPLQFYIVGFTGKSRNLFETIQGCVNWDVYAMKENYTEAFNKDEIVYLTSDSSNVLETLSDDKVYVIGGLVDHNHYKGLSHRLAEEKKIQHARLPIGEYLEMNTRKVLTIFHVFEILLRFTECKDWKKAFFDVIPKRKLAGSKDGEESDDDDDDDDDDDQEEQK